MRKTLGLAVALLCVGTALAGDHNHMQNDDNTFLSHHIGSQFQGHQSNSNPNADENLSTHLGADL